MHKLNRVFLTNMHLKNVLLYIYLFYLTFTKSTSIDEELGNKYRFDLFENFDGIKEVYMEEAKFVRKLMSIKTKILESKDELERFLQTSKQDHENMLKNLREVISNCLKNQNEYSKGKHFKKFLAEFRNFQFHIKGILYFYPNSHNTRLLVIKVFGPCQSLVLENFFEI